MTAAPDSSLARGREVFERLVGGEGLIGLIPDVPEAEKEMMRCLWQAADEGMGPPIASSVSATSRWWSRRGRSGKRGPVDMANAASFYERATRAGNGRAAAMLAVMVLEGQHEGTPAEAGRWLDAAEELGFPALDLLDAAGLSDPRSDKPA